MIFKETLDKFKMEVEEALDELFGAVKTNQTHEQDLLLIEINGFYEEKHNEPEVKKRFNLSPFVFGPQGWTYFADRTQYNYFNFWRRNISGETRNQFFSDYDTNLDKETTYDIILQQELMIYLKFWESDRMLKKIYHLTNLALGNNYDWFFDIGKDDSRHILIREKIRDPLEKVCPKYYQLLKDIYLSQIRNAVAHSQFYITKQKLGFCNFDENNHAPLSQIDFEDWEVRFHKLILYYNGLLKRFNESHDDYVRLQEGKEFGLQIRLTDKNSTETTNWIKYVQAGRLDWMWYDVWKKRYKNKK